MWRRSLIIVAVLCGLIAGTVVALKSRRVADNLKAYLARTANERFGVTLRIDQLELELLPPGVALAGVEVYRPERDEAWIRLHRGRVVVRPWPSAAGALVIHRLEVDGFEADLDLRGIDNLWAPDPEGPGTGLAVDVRELLVWNTELAVATDDGRVAVHGADVRMEPSPRGGRDVAVSVASGEIEHDGREFSFETNARGMFRGSIDRPEELTLERATVNLRRVAFSATGSIQLEGEPQLDLAVVGAAPLNRLREWAPDLPAIDGRFVGTAQVQGPLATLRSRVRATLSDLRLENAELGDLEFDAVHSGLRVNLESFRYSHPHAGLVTGSGHAEIAPAVPVNITARLHKASLPHILDLAGVPDAWVRLLFSGDVRAEGRLNPLSLQLDVGGTVSQFTVQDRAYWEAEPAVTLALEPTDISGPASITTRGVTVRGVSVTRGDSELTVEGGLSFDELVGMDLRANAEYFDLTDVGPIAAILFEGTGPIAAAIEGPYGAPTISGTAELDDFAVHGFAAGDTKATVIYNDLTLRIDRATVRRGGGTLTGSGAINFGAAVPQVHAAFSADRVDTRDILSTVGLSDTVAARFTAPLIGDIRVDGPLALPDGEFTAEIPRLAIDGVGVGHAKVRGGFGDRDERLWVALDLKPKRGALTSRVGWLADDTLTIDADVDGIAMTLITPFIGDVPLTGELTGETKLRGPATALSGNVTASVQALTAWGLKLETTRLDGKLLDGQMSVRGSTLSGDTPLEATLDIGRTIPFTATANATALDVERIYPLGDSVGLTVSGTFFAQGDLMDPESLMADVQLQSGSLDVAGFELSSARPVRLQYANGLYRVDDLALTGVGAQLTINGTVAVDGALDLKIVGTGDLRSAGNPGRDLQWTRGSFDVDTRVGGVISAPQLYGAGNVRDVALRTTSGTPVVDDLNARLDFAGRGIRLEAGTGVVGGGHVRFGGQLALPPGDAPQLDVRADLADIKLRPYPDLETQFSGRLNLVGPVRDLLLKGRIQLESLRYSVNIDLERLIPKRNAPLSVPAFEQGQAVALAVAVEAPNNILISNNVIEAEFQTDLMITGTTERLGLIGSLTPLWGKAYYRDNVFEIERASIDFTEEYRIFTRFDIHTTTRACDMKISVDVHGNSDRQQVVPTGQDESGSVDPQDVLACLQVGMRLATLQDRANLRDTQPAESDPWARVATSEWATGLDALWAVSGMDEKVNRLLPIRLDEVRLESGWSSQYKRSTMRLLVGKEVSENLHLKISSSLEETTDQTYSIEYRLNDTATVQGSYLTASDVPIGDLGVDLRLRWEFR